MELKITTLVENTVKDRSLLGEHGLSFHIQADNKSIIFDTGQGMSLHHNASLLNINLNDISSIVLSHGHYDHTGGLKRLIDRDIPGSIPGKMPLTIRAHQGVFMEKYKKSNNHYKEIGMPASIKDSLHSSIKIILNKEPVEIEKNIYLTGEIPEVKKNDGFYTLNNQNEYIPDSFRDEQALFIKTPKGLVVILGCAHTGIINTLEHIKSLTDDNIYAVLGGTHLLNAREQELIETVEKIKELNINTIGLCHCTGIDSYAYLKSKLPHRVYYTCTGSEFLL